ncbi:M56 family metallopeptidase [Dyadobacter aurulentus]|uniref:M56 family metallopeptidase n=1 Tax=Dyadobacter sp. UC 10 TaxID=2605428 RepID=UPI0011F19107|nr:M56 family metallopeptidase [Dyadobacter sp. UC 10]KAA0992031.1 M56 family metallopeptidase [Dyadobacter sp. UC 10]
MISYLIKSILCSGILILVYQLFLEREKMHAFNRYYLLLSIAFSLLVPLISIEIQPETVIEPLITTVPEMLEQTELMVVSREKIADTSDPTNPINYLMLLISLITMILLIRFGKNILAILKLKNKCSRVRIPDARLVLVPKDVVTYTFLKYIFVSEKSFKNQQVRGEILAHELAHARQMHSLDIIFIELVQACMWINPFLFFYKKAIRLNHEFLADEAVLKEYSNVKNYQLLLLDTVLHKAQVSLTSSFNYSVTKKRLKMMTRFKNLNRQYAKQFAIALLGFVLTFIFSDKIYAQIETGGKLVAEALPEIRIARATQSPVKPKATEPVKTIVKFYKRNPGPGISAAETEEFYGTIEEYTTYVKNKKGRTDPIVRMPSKLEDRMYVLFKKMNLEQLEMADDSGIMVFQMQIPVKKAPDATMFENWKKPSVFGVWIDGKKVPNIELDKYKPTDIAEYWMSKLYGAALKGRSYKYQLDLTTNDRFDKTYERRVSDRVNVGRVGWVGERPKKFGK